MWADLCLNPAARNSYVIIGTQEIYNYVTTVELVNCEHISKSRLKDMMGDSSEVLAANTKESHNLHIVSQAYYQVIRALAK